MSEEDGFDFAQLYCRKCSHVFPREGIDPVSKKYIFPGKCPNCGSEEIEDFVEPLTFGKYLDRKKRSYITFLDLLIQRVREAILEDQGMVYPAWLEERPTAQEVYKTHWSEHGQHRREVAPTQPLPNAKKMHKKGLKRMAEFQKNGLRLESSISQILSEAKKHAEKLGIKIVEESGKDIWKDVEGKVLNLLNNQELMLRAHRKDLIQVCGAMLYLNSNLPQSQILDIFPELRERTLRTYIHVLKDW